MMAAEREHFSESGQRWFLVGMPLSGKTTQGKKLANLLKLPFWDLDALLEAQQQKPVSKLFEEEGEAAFRWLEHQYLLHHLPEVGVISCGGGTPCFHGNMEWMKQHGRVVWISVPTGVLLQRLSSGGAGDRPLFRGKTRDEQMAFLRQLENDREGVYRQAQEQWNPVLEKPEAFLGRVLGG